MDIEDFIEQDVIVYLDRVLSEDHREDDRHSADQVSTVFLSRDYEEELAAALADGNVVKAKRVLHDLKAKLDETPDAGKPQVKDLLARLYEQFKQTVEKGVPPARPEPRSTPAADLPPPPPKHYASVTPPKPDASAPAQRAEPSPAPVQAVMPVPVPPEPARQEPASLPVPTAPDTTAAEEALATADSLLAAGDLHGAIKAFRQGKSALLDLRSVPDNIVSRYREMYMRLRDAHGKMAAPRPPVPEPTKAISMLDKDLLLQLEREKRRLDAQLHAHDIAGAMATYRGMRLLVQQMQDAKTAEDAAKKMVRIYEIIGAFVPRVNP